MLIRRHPTRGLALITVMLLLTTVLYLTLALLIRSNSNLFASNRQVQSAQAFYAADCASREKAMLLVQQFWLSGSAQTAITSMQSTINHDFPVYDVNGNTVGYADITYSIGSPEVNTSGDFGTGSYVTVTVEATGSSQDSSYPWRATRTIDISYNFSQSGLAIDALNFAYFMDHWAWFTDFGLNQVQIIGNTAANGNYDVTQSSPSNPGYLKLYNGPTYTYSANGTAYNSNPYTALYLRASSVNKQLYPSNVYGIVNGPNGWQPPNPNAISTDVFGLIPLPGNLASIPTDGGTYENMASSQQGKLSLETVKVTNQSPLQYSVDNTQTLTVNGVYGEAGSGQKENVVLDGTVTVPKVGQTMTIVSIQGPVVVKGNVVIQGYITGQGTLYAGRDIYVSGNLTYANPPSCYPSSTATPNGVPQPSSADSSKDQVLMCAGGSVVYGDVTNSTQWSAIMDWFNYVDPVTGEHVNDNHEDAGLDKIVNSLQYNPADVKENDGLWTVEIQNPQTGQVQMADLPLVNNIAQVPAGWSVIPGTGEDTDGNGLYTPALDYNRDFMFASSPASNGSWTAETFSSTYFDNYPGGTYTSFCTPITRVDGFMMANATVAGWLGDNKHNLVFYGGEAARQDGTAIQLNGYSNSGPYQYMYQDVRFSQQNTIGAPSSTRTVLAQWSEK